MLTMDDLNPLLRRRSTVVTGGGEKVGTVGAVYLGDADEQPAWVTVHTGLLGARESFVPLGGARVRGHELVVDHDRDLIKRAPSIDRDEDLSPEEEAALYRHYGLSVVPHVPDAEPPSVVQDSEPFSEEVHEVPSPVPDAEPSSVLEDEPVRASTAEPGARGQGGVRTHDEGGTPWVVRSEEKLRVGIERYEAGRFRLRKYVVTEEATVSVPLRAEDVRVVVEPITSSTGQDTGGALFQEEAVELVAREEIAVVRKETVPVERVRMRTVESTGRATVRAEVRKERISVSVDGESVEGAEGAARGAVKRKANASGPDGSATVPTKNGNALVKGKKRRR